MWVQIEAYLMSLADEAIALHSQRFFKTGPGEYGEGDQFLGIRVPKLRQALPTFKRASLEDIAHLLQSPWHEIRLFALLLAVKQFQTHEGQQQAVFELFLTHFDRINNWDLVDTTVPHVIGAYLFKHPEQQIYLLDWVQSQDLWTRRIAVLATFYFIRHDQIDWSLTLAERLLSDLHDLIHKAVGWMLREVGKKDLIALRCFLALHGAVMPRTMLRYAIEQLTPEERKTWLKQTRR